MNNILITSAGQRVSLVQAFQKELINSRIDGKVFTTDLNPKLSAACNVSDKYFKVERVTESSYIDTLLDICISNNIKMKVPTIDTELQILADNNKLFEENGIHIVISSPEFISICRDKRKTNVFFEAHDITIPKSRDKYNPTFPLFIKPNDGSLSSNIFIINSFD